MNRVAVLLALLGVALVVGGIGALAGPAWAAITAGVVSVAAAVGLYDPDEGRERR